MWSPTDILFEEFRRLKPSLDALNIDFPYLGLREVVSVADGESRRISRVVTMLGLQPT